MAKIKFNVEVNRPKTNVVDLVEEAREIVENIDCARTIRDCAIAQSKELLAKHKKALKCASECLQDIQRYQRRLAEIGKLLQDQGV